MSRIIFNDNHLGALMHFRQEVINNLAEEGNKICLIAPSEDKHTKFKNLNKDVRIYSIKLNRTSVSIRNLFFYFSSLYRIVKNEKPDWIFNFTILPIIVGGIASKLTKSKSTAIFAGLNEQISRILNHTSLKSKIIRLCLKYILSFNKYIVFLNNEDRDILLKSGIINQKQVIMMTGGEGVNLEKYSPPSFKKQDPNNLKIAMVSRVLKTKGFKEFAYCASECHRKNVPIQFYLAGGLDESHPAGINKDEIMKYHNSGILTYLGHVSNIIEFLSGIDCVVLPSYYNEGMNRSLMEALSMGIPIITTDNRGCRELVIPDKTGYIIRPQDKYDLLEAVLKFYNLPTSQKAAMRLASRRYAEERFDVKKTIEVYKSIINHS